MKQILHSYFFGASEALLAYQREFRKAHPDVEMIDSVLVAEVTINGETGQVSYSDIESVRDQMNVDIVANQRAAEICSKFVQRVEPKN